MDNYYRLAPLEGNSQRNSMVALIDDTIFVTTFLKADGFE